MHCPSGLKICACEYYHSYISDVEKSQCKADNDENNSLSSVNYGPGILLRALYTLSYLTGISINIDTNRNNDQSVAFVLNRDFVNNSFLLNFPDDQFL